MELKAIKPTNGTLASFGCIFKDLMLMNPPVVAYFNVSRVNEVDTMTLP